MARIISRARQLRLDYSARLGHAVSIQEVGDRLAISRKRLTQLELGKFDAITNGELIALCRFYSEVLGRPVTISDVLEFDPNNIGVFALAMA